MKLVIGIPYHDSFTIPWKFAQSLFGAMPFLYKELGLENVDLIFQTGTLVSNVRNGLLMNAQKLNPDYMLWIDSDMSFTKDDILNLLKNKSDGLVSALYLQGTEPHYPNAYMRVDGLTGLFRSVKDPVGLIDIDACGFGFCLMGKKALYGMGAQPFNEITQDGFHVSEDLSFCIRAKERGIDIKLDSTIKVGHLRVKEV